MVTVYGMGRSDIDVFRDFEFSMMKELKKAGYTVAECRVNLNFRSPRCKIEAYNHSNQQYINHSFHLQPAMQGFDFAMIPAMRFLRANIVL